MNCKKLILLTSLWLSGCYFGSHGQVVHHEQNNSQNIEEKCPVDGANLHIRCADSSEKSFGIGYGKDLYILKDGKLILDSAADFCRDMPVEIDFYLKQTHFQLAMRKKSNTVIGRPWTSVKDECTRQNFDKLEYQEFKTIKVQSIHISEPKPAERELD